VARRVDRGALATAPLDDDGEGGRAVIFGFGRVGRLIGEMLGAHGQAYIAVDSSSELVKQARDDGFPVLFGDVGNALTVSRLALDRARALIVTMDEPVLVSRIVRKLRGTHPDLPIIVRARDPGHAAQLYRMGATHAVPETLESSLQLSEAVLVDLGYPMGPVIASIHEKRDEFRAAIMEDGELDEKPRLRTGKLSDREPLPSAT
jgi:CPA2 family monovalent cation:H+ antiporter-2